MWTLILEGGYMVVEDSGSSLLISSNFSVNKELAEIEIKEVLETNLISDNTCIPTQHLFKNLKRWLINWIPLDHILKLHE